MATGDVRIKIRDLVAVYAVLFIVATSAYLVSYGNLDMVSITLFVTVLAIFAIYFVKGKRGYEKVTSGVVLGLGSFALYILIKYVPLVSVGFLVPIIMPSQLGSAFLVFVFGFLGSIVVYDHFSRIVPGQSKSAIIILAIIAVPLYMVFTLSFLAIFTVTFILFLAYWFPILIFFAFLRLKAGSIIGTSLASSLICVRWWLMGFKFSTEPSWIDSNLYMVIVQGVTSVFFLVVGIALVSRFARRTNRSSIN